MLKNNPCEDKDSVHYFMCHMTQYEFNQRYPYKPQEYKFNKIKHINKDAKDGLD